MKTHLNNQKLKCIHLFNLTYSANTFEDESRSTSQINEIPILSSYEGIEVPTIFLKDIESYETKGWREPGIIISDYFNYGMNTSHRYD